MHYIIFQCLQIQSINKTQQQKRDAEHIVVIRHLRRAQLQALALVLDEHRVQRHRQHVQPRPGVALRVKVHVVRGVQHGPDEHLGEEHDALHAVPLSEAHGLKHHGAQRLGVAEDGKRGHGDQGQTLKGRKDVEAEQGRARRPLARHRGAETHHVLAPQHEDEDGGEVLQHEE